MKFIDEAIITVQSGNGGRGCVSFRREKFVPKGGPDGGDGGSGGSIIFITSPGKRTLQQFRYKKHLKAHNGSPGLGKLKHGKNGKDIIIEIPPGTIVFEAESGDLIKDFTHTGESFTLAKGGRGGRGNARFKSSTNRTPRFAQPGESGESINLKLELKLLADVGIIGLPNAGKSTLIKAISSANPKVGSYPFTTLVPNLGSVSTEWGEPFIVADIPGLIEGAHEGAGLGIRFLRHIERTRVLIHLIDASMLDFNSPLDQFDTINRELGLYSKDLADKPQIIVLNKLDIPGSREASDKFRSTASDKFRSLVEENEVLAISALSGEGINKLISRVIQLLEKSP